MNSDQIVIRGAREHNLKNVDLELPRDQLDRLHRAVGIGEVVARVRHDLREGQRRYVESLSAYARQFLGQMDKPDVDFIEGLSPAISIDQKSASRNPRSTVGTITEIYDYLRLLYARIGVPHCPNCGRRDHPPDAAADRRPRAAAPRGHPVPGARAGRARPQGRVRRPARRARGAGVHPGPGRRRDRRARRRRAGAARPLREPHHRGRRRPARAPRRHRAPPHRLARDRAAARRGRRRGRDRRRRDERSATEPRDPHVLGAPRVHALRAVVRRARAAQLLVQLALRRVRRVRRARHQLPGRPRARRPRRRSLDRRRRDRAVVGLPRRVLRPGARPRSASEYGF